MCGRDGPVRGIRSDGVGFRPGGRYGPTGDASGSDRKVFGWPAVPAEREPVYRRADAAGSGVGHPVETFLPVQRGCDCFSGRANAAAEKHGREGVGMEFKSIRKVTRFLDPRTGLSETRVESEVRLHPLTGRTSRVAHFSLRGASRPDPEELIAATRENCPFCPQAVERETPMFPPDLVPRGRLRRNEATVVPNLFPYDAYSALTIITKDHYVPLHAFTEERLSDTFGLPLVLFEIGACLRNLLTLDRRPAAG